MRRHLSYANVAATLALVGVIGGGGAYAAGQIGSQDVRNNSLRSADLKNRRAVRAVDVHPNGLTGRQIREHTLRIGSLISVEGAEPAGCDPSGTEPIDCAQVKVPLLRAARVLAIATGGQESNGGPAKAVCQVRIDGEPSPLSAAPGEEATDNTSISATNGFARTVVTPLLPRGVHTASLACSELSGDVRIENPTLAALAVSVK